MNIIVQAVIVKNLESIEIFGIRVDDHNYIKVRKRLEFEKFKIICMLKQMKDSGEIKSIWRPKNRKIQDKLDDLVDAKNMINKSIDKIRAVFYVNR